jgi:hypothetical protein
MGRQTAGNTTQHDTNKPIKASPKMVAPSFYPAISFHWLARQTPAGRPTCPARLGRR